MKPGWDERDYRLWSEIQQLPSYGLHCPNDHMISLNDVVRVMEEQASLRLSQQITDRKAKR